MQIKNDISIRSIQHYLYCAHRWGLIEIGKVWAENYFVTKANLIHQNVHEKSIYAKRGKKVFSAVSVYHDEYGLFGIVDCLEGSPSANGVKLIGEEERYHLCIVEYKPTKPKNKLYYHEDMMQVFAQKICVDYVFHCDCDAVLYYADVRQRIQLPLRENYTVYEQELGKILKEMEGFLELGNIPPVKKGQNCNGCSLKDVCMPSKKSFQRIRRQVTEMSDDD